MNNNMNFKMQNGNDSHLQGEQKPNAELDLFAEELPEQHDLLKGECVACAFTAGTAGGTVSSFSTWGSFS
jgi:hypothetical protein